ncbi:MAG: RNA polymerase sigma factor [Cyclobacteriaceae bacterium]
MKLVKNIREEELIAAIARGDERYFRYFVEKYKDKIYNTCLGFLRNPEDAEDVAQEVFIEVHESITQFKQQSSLNTWLYSIATNKCLEHIRSRTRKKRFTLFASKDVYEQENKFAEYVHPGIQAENKERAKILMNAIEKLNEKQRSAFVLHKIEMLSQNEIAEVLQTSVSGVESLLHRAKVNLRKMLNQYYQENEK